MDVQLMWSQSALPSTPGASSHQDSCQGLFAVWEFTLAKPAAWHSSFCPPKKAVQDKACYNCITMFESCHLCCFGASKQGNAPCAEGWIPAEEERPWKEIVAWGTMCCLHLSASGTWTSSPSATCANAKQICLNWVRGPFYPMESIGIIEEFIPLLGIWEHSSFSTTLSQHRNDTV